MSKSFLGKELLVFTAHPDDESYVAAGTIFLAGNTERFHPAMAYTARLGFFHLGHGKALFVSQVEDGIVTHSAIIIIFLKVKLVTEDDRFRIFEFKLDVLGFDCSGADDR